MNTGLRRGEVVKLRWGSVDFNRLLTVEGRNAKNRQTRHVPLNDEAVSVLRNWREQSGTGARAFRVATGFRTAWARSSSGPGSVISAGTICATTLLRA
jgi:integrase